MRYQKQHSKKKARVVAENQDNPTVASVQGKQTIWKNFSKVADPTDLKINKYMPYTIDSIGFYCVYYRGDSTPTAVDTLQFQVLVDGDGNYYWEQGGNPWVMTDYGTDTLWFKGIKHDALINYTTDPMYMTYKLPLTAAMAVDTLSNGIPSKSISISCNEETATPHLPTSPNAIGSSESTPYKVG